MLICSPWLVIVRGAMVVTSVLHIVQHFKHNWVTDVSRWHGHHITPHNHNVAQKTRACRPAGGGGGRGVLQTPSGRFVWVSSPTLKCGTRLPASQRRRQTRVPMVDTRASPPILKKKSSLHSPKEKVLKRTKTSTCLCFPLGEISCTERADKATANSSSPQMCCS